MVTDLFEVTEPKINTQHYTILRYLRNGCSLTPLEALQIAKTFKLSSRIGELRKLGHKINSEWIKLPSGKKVKKYYLEVSNGQ